jgi:hypothetical protein
MKRDASLIRLSRDHHRGLVMSMRIERDLPTADAAEAAHAVLIVDEEDAGGGTEDRLCFRLHGA